MRRILNIAYRLTADEVDALPACPKWWEETLTMIRQFTSPDKD